MLIYKRTSLLESSSHTLVNTVNCVGVMGKGVAKAFKSREPEMFKAYKLLCDRNQLKPGKLWLWRGSEQWILNFPTKVHWRNSSRLEWIEAGLEKFVQTYEDQGITEIAFPKLGCGNGGLDWDDVRPMMESYLGHLSIPVFIHDFTMNIGLPEHLEAVASAVSEKGVDLSFAGFVSALAFVAEISPSMRMNAGASFQAFFDSENLVICTSDGKWTLEKDDLRGVWFSLLNGLVTEEKAGWIAPSAGLPLLTMMQLLPSVRAVEILRSGSDEPEMAVELKPEVMASIEAKDAIGQTEFTWH